MDLFEHLYTFGSHSKRWSRKKSVFKGTAIEVLLMKQEVMVKKNGDCSS